MVEDLTKVRGIISYTLSTGERINVTSDMSESQIQTVQRKYWDSFSQNYHPKTTSEIEENIKVKEKHHQEKHHQHQ